MKMMKKKMKENINENDDHNNNNSNEDEKKIFELARTSLSINEWLAQFDAKRYDRRKGNRIQCDCVYVCCVCDRHSHSAKKVEIKMEMLEKSVNFVN